MSGPLPKTADEFLLALSDSRLLSVQQIESLKAVRPCESEDGAAWVAELVERGFLTDFQAEQLLAGHGGQLVLGQYRILDRLGSGGMGHVYRAEHTIMKRVVALKIIATHLVKDAGAVARFHHEIELAARLSHPNIIAAYDAAEADGLHFLVMEYVDGIDLGRRVKETGPLAVVEACEYIRQAGLGLQHAHEHGLVHCDIKPANLLIRRQAKATHGHVTAAVLKILDFGLARLAGSPSASMNILNRHGEDAPFAGTPDFVAPEQAHDCRAADIRGDLYSLGCTFYYLLTGQVPLPGGTWSEKMLRHQFDPVQPVDELRPDVPEQVAAIVHRLLAKSPDERYQLPIHLADALGAWLFTQGDGPFETPLAVPSISSVNTPHAGEGLTIVTPNPEELRQRESERIDVSPQARVSMLGQSLFTWPVAIAVAILLGLGIAVVARHSSQAKGKSTLAWAAGTQAAANSISLASMPGKWFRQMEDAVAAAQDGDTLSIHGDGPFSMTPISIRGKSLTIKAAEGFHPRLDLTQTNLKSAWQPLLLADQPLVLEGLELTSRNTAGLSTSCLPTYLVYCEGASLRMAHCRLVAPHGSALVVCRHATQVELRDCSLAAKTSAICLEVEHNVTPEFRLVNTSVTVNDTTGAAISLWTSLTGVSARARLSLERDRIIAGRVVAAAGPLDGLQVSSEGNDLTIHQALLSCAGFIDPDCWRKLPPWHGRDNRYHGHGNRLLVDGTAVDVTALPAWREYSHLTDALAPEAAPASPFQTALREPAN